MREDEKGITRTIVFKKDQGEEEELVEDITYTEKMKVSGLVNCSQIECLSFISCSVLMLLFLSLLLYVTI